MRVRESPRRERIGCVVATLLILTFGLLTLGICWRCAAVLRRGAIPHLSGGVDEYASFMETTLSDNHAGCAI